MTSFLFPVKLLLGTALLLHLHGSYTDAACDKCEVPSLPDCEMGRVSPADGGPPCSCVSTASLRGCVLKPCGVVADDSVCDISLGTGSIPKRNFAYNFRCTGKNGQCETCQNTPPDCTYNAYVNPPASGGPPCACDNQMSPPGCTMKLCSKKSKPGNPDPCICEPGVPAFICYNATCPGNLKAEASGSKVIVSSPVTLIVALMSGISVWKIIKPDF